MRVRIATRIYNSKSQDSPAKLHANTQPKQALGTGYDTNIFDQPSFRVGVNGENGMSVEVGDGVSTDEQKVLDRVAEDLARLGRVKRVGLGVEEKIEFVKVWRSRRR